MPEKTIAPSASKTNADVIPVRRAGSVPFQPPTSVKGFAYARSDGTTSLSGTTNGTTLWSLASPMHLGFAGEAVTHLAAVRMIQDGWLSASDPAFAALSLNVAPAFEDITVGQLLTHTSGMAGSQGILDYGLGPGQWVTLMGYIGAYLSQAGVPQPVNGAGFQRNFIDTTLLSAVVEAKAIANGYVGYGGYVRNVLLAPMGDNLLAHFQQGSILDAEHRTLAYSSADGTEAFDWESHRFFSWYNWVATPSALLTFLANVRTNPDVLSASGRAALLDGTTAWRTSNGVVYFGGNNTWTRENAVAPPYPGLAVAAASYTPPSGSATDAVLFVNSPYVLAVDAVVDSLLPQSR